MNSTLKIPSARIPANTTKHGPLKESRRTDDIWKKAFATIVACMLPLNALSAEWQYVGSSADGTVFIDNKRVAKKGQKVKAWFMLDLKKAQMTESYRSKSYRSREDLIYVNCTERTSAIAQTLLYSEDAESGDIVDSMSTQEKLLIYVDPVPDSIGEMMLDAACSRASEK